MVTGKTRIDRYLDFFVIAVILFSLFCQVRSMVLMKGFWLDEWFILYNIKFRNFSELFGNLFAMQQFPRVYLSIIKFIVDFFNYNYYAIRIIPFTIQVINIIFVYKVISKIVFPENKIYALLFVLLFLSFHTSLFYFSQLKQYTMDIFLTLMATWFFSYVSHFYQNIKIVSWFYFIMLFCIFTGPFFSYTFPIVITPVIIIFFISFLIDVFNHKFTLKPLLPIIIFILALILNYFTDLQFVLHDKGQYQNFNTYVMNYSSLNLFWKGLLNIGWLFTSIFFFDKAYNIFFLSFLYLLKVSILVFSIYGLCILGWKELTKIRANTFYYFKSLSFSEKPGIQIYFLGVLVLTIILYLLKMLPLGTHRINYFCWIFISYFSLTGFFYLVDKFRKIRIPFFFIMFFAAAIPAIASDINELKNTNLDFDQKIYENVGNAINAAKKNSIPILVQWNEFYPKSIDYGQEKLMIIAHHEYKPKDSIKVYMAKMPELDSLPEKLHLNKYILLKKYSFQILTNN